MCLSWYVVIILGLGWAVKHKSAKKSRNFLSIDNLLNHCYKGTFNEGGTVVVNKPSYHIKYYNADYEEWIYLNGLAVPLEEIIDVIKAYLVDDELNNWPVQYMIIPVGVSANA